MPHGECVVYVSCTELPQFRRLAEFLQEAEDLGRVNADEELLALVERCRDQLAEQYLGPGD